MQAYDSGTELVRLQTARTSLSVLEPRVLAGEPWPLAEAFGTEPEASWGPRDVLAHLAEMLPFWLGELERVVDGEPAPVPFGRTADDVVRIGLLERDRTLPLRVLFGRIDRGLHDWAERLPTLSAEERAKLGRHPRLGDMGTGGILERFVIGHAEEHVAQIEALLPPHPG